MFVVVIQLLSHVWLFVTPLTAAHQAFLFFTISWNLLKFMSIESISSFAISSFASLFYFCLQSFPLSELALHINWPKHRSFDFSTSPSNEYSGLTSFRIDSLTLPSVQGTLKSLLQHHISKASILWVLSLLYDPTLTSVHDYWKNHSFDYVDPCQQSDVSGFSYTA